jgi:cbb3-type cytochrome oxidase maturation protein
MMDEFFYLVPLSLVLGVIGLGLFLWSLRNGQYEDLDGAAERILYEDDTPSQPGS